MLAAKCGATYISPFVGRLDAIGQFGMEVVRQIKTIYKNYDYKTQVLTAAVRARRLRSGVGRTAALCSDASPVP